jgi:mono/diheme cytochrome c family protein
MMLRQQRLIPVALAAAPLVALAIASCSGPAQQASTQEAAFDSVAHGRYLTAIMSCNDCHTPGTLFGAPDTTRLLSGSEVGWQGPWGVSYARNLTPDSLTGIGTWTSEQIVNALRTGQRPDGSHILLPPMPWPMYTGLTDKDAYCIAAYMKSIPAVSHKVPDIVPPGQKVKGPVIPFPQPSAWDAPKVQNTQGKPASGGGGA